MPSEVKEVAIDSIDMNGRHRKSMGNVQELCDSIEAVGLLHPVVITKDKKLVAGSRRIAAYQKLGRKKIPTCIATTIDDATKRLIAERDENTCRLDFSTSEAVAMGLALEELERPKAKERQATSTGGKNPKPAYENFSEAEKGTTRAKVGAAVGMSGPTYNRAKFVVKAAEEDPKTFGPIADEMEKTGKVHPAYDKVVAIKKNGTRTEDEEPAPKNGRTPVGVLRANEAIDCLKRIPKNDAHRKRGFQIVSDYIRHNK